MSLVGMTQIIVSVRTPSKVVSGDPESAPIVTGLPVIASCILGSEYLSKNLSAGVGRTTVWVMALRMTALTGSSCLAETAGVVMG